MENFVAKLLFIVGVLTIIVGTIVGVLLMTTNANGIMFLISAVVSGMFVIGFAEVINLLHQINKKLG
ncbi:MAG: hypothetical protein LRY71_19550 [Bacillaceae bacterium]|nr:hypothetical protein [Bacillaceae bacterium]